MNKMTWANAALNEHSPVEMRWQGKRRRATGSQETTMDMRRHPGDDSSDCQDEEESVVRSE